MSRVSRMSRVQRGFSRIFHEHELPVSSNNDNNEDNEDSSTPPNSNKNSNKNNNAWGIVGSLLTLGFSAAGLALTLEDKVRGDKYLFTVAFSVSIALSSLQVLLTCATCVTICIVKFRRNSTDNKMLLLLLPFITTLVVGVLGSMTSFGLLIAALASSSDIEPEHSMGCDHYGCANIMAIAATIVYGLTVCGLIVFVCCTFLGASIAACIYYRLPLLSSA